MVTKQIFFLKACVATLIVGVISCFIIPQVSYGFEENDIDVSTGWEVLDYESDLGIDIRHVFGEGGISLSGMKYATTNFFNIGNSHFKATKTIPMKKGNIYNFDLVYALRPQGKAVGYIDFNGTKLTETQPTNKAYVETVKPTENQNYVITMEFTAPKNTGMYLMVGQNATGGVTITPAVTIPTVEVPEAWTEKVSGTGNSENIIKIMDASNKLIGTGVVNKDNTFEIKTDRILIHNEILTVTQTNEAEESSPISTQVKDTIAPSSPEIQNINENNQQIIGTSESNSKIEVRDKDGILIGTGIATNEGEVSFYLMKELKRFDQVTVTAIDEAGNKSMPIIIPVVSNGVIVPTPSVKAPESGTRLVLGNGLVGSTIKIMDSSNHLIGTGQVNQSNEFQVTTSRRLVYKEIVKVSQVNDLGKESALVSVEVQDTIAPGAPKIQDINENNQQIIGTSEPNSKIEVKDKDGILVGTGITTNEGHVSFKLMTLLKLFDQVSIIAGDEAGNKSDASIVTVRSDSLLDESKFTQDNEPRYDVILSIESPNTAVNRGALPSTSKNVVKTLPKTGEKNDRFKNVAILFNFIAIYIIFLNKKRKWGK